MRWIYEKKKMICAAAAIVFAVLVTGVTAEKKGMLAQAKIASVQKRMAKEVFRFHVLANSDSEEDQELKMKVKGEIIAYMKICHIRMVWRRRRRGREHIRMRLKKWLHGPLKKPDMTIR